MCDQDRNEQKSTLEVKPETRKEKESGEKKQQRQENPFNQWKAAQE